MSPGRGIETHISAIADANADDVAIGEAKLQYVAGPGLADDQYRLAGRDGFARFDQATQYDAVAGRDDLGMAAVVLRGIELCERNRGRGAEIVELLAGDDVVVKQLLPAFVVARCLLVRGARLRQARSEEHTSELQSLMRISYAVFCLKKKINTHTTICTRQIHITH